MEGQRERTSSRRRQRRKSKNPRGKITIEPVLIAARRPDSPLLNNAFRDVIASAQPKGSGRGGVIGVRLMGADSEAIPAGQGAQAISAAGALSLETAVGGVAPAEAESRSLEAEGGGDTHAASNGTSNGAASHEERADAPRRRAVRIVKAQEAALGPGNREQQLLDRLLRSQGRGAITRAANDLWESKITLPRQQEIHIQLLEHENEQRARDAVFVMAELLQREAPIQRPVLDQRLRRLEQSAEDPITRDAAGALRRSMRVHHGGL